MENDKEIMQLRLGERENGYMQCYTDLLNVLLECQEKNWYNLDARKAEVFINEKMQQQLEVRKVTGFSHPIEIAKG